MFGLSWEQIILILLAALFLLGPERIPVALKWGMESLRKLRTMAAGAQEELRSQVGPELEELRRQVAELQSLKEIGELRALRDLNPRTMIGKNILGDEFSGGITGFLGLNKPDGDGAAVAGPGANGTPGPAAANGAATTNGAAATNGTANGAATDGTAATVGSAGAPFATGSGTSTLTATRATRTLTTGEIPPFDPEGT
jgi:sec-independent protein translocase protein TatB